MLKEFRPFINGIVFSPLGCTQTCASSLVSWLVQVKVNPKGCYKAEQEGIAFWWHHCQFDPPLPCFSASLSPTQFHPLPPTLYALCPMDGASLHDIIEDMRIVSR